MPKDAPKPTDNQAANPSARNNVGSLLKTPQKSSTTVNGPTSPTNAPDSTTNAGSAKGTEFMAGKPVEITLANA